jgi:DNA polymerase-3 subunit alpha (Gram-positive type)
MVSEELIKPLQFCIIDLETTGGNHKYDKIIEIGIARIENLQLTDKKSYLINPEIPIPEFIQKLTSIKESDIVDSPKIEEVIDDVLEFIGDAILVAHNTSFDIPFLNSVLKRLKYPAIKNRVICTNVMTKYLIPEMMNSNLSHMCNIFNIEHEQAHRAISDATSTAHLLLKYLHIFINKNIRKINQLYYPRNKFELDRIHVKNNSDKDEILTKVLKLKSPFTLVEKGHHGLILNCTPIQDATSEQDYIKSLFSKKDWDILTVKLNSHFLESLIIYKDIYNKIVPENKNLTLDWLKQKTFYTQDIEATPAKINKFFDSVYFLVSQHLIPEQYTITANYNFSLKQSLIFKYPSHKKKLEQFVKNQVTRLKQGNRNIKKCFPDDEILQVFYRYLYFQKNQEDSRYLFIGKNDISANLKKFHTLMKTKTKHYKNEYEFPIIHL